MFNKKMKLIFCSIFLVIMISVQPVSGAVITWHSSIKTDGSWKWKVTDRSGAISSAFRIPGVKNLQKDVILEIKAVGNPPTAGDWDSLIGSASLAWCDYYINGTKQANDLEYGVYYLITPLGIGIIKGWKEAAYDMYSYIQSIANIVEMLNGDITTETIVKTEPDSTTVKYEINLVGESWNGNHFSYKYQLSYNNETGFLKNYIYNHSNATLTSSITLEQQSGGLLGDIPGFEVYGALFGLGFIAVITILRRKKRLNLK